MSSKNINSKDHKPDKPKAKPKANPGFLPRPKTLAKKLSLDHHNDGLEIKGSSSLRDAFLVVVGKPGGDSAVQLTFHHPIGKTPLEKDEWVATPTLEVKNLLQRAEDPFLAEKKKHAEQECFEHAVSKGWLLRAADGFQFWDGQPRSEFKRLQKDMTPEEFLAKVPGATHKLSIEETIRKRREDLFKRIESVQSSYETKSGPSWDRRQTAIAGLKGLTSSQVMDRIVQNLTKPAEAGKPKAPRSTEVKPSTTETKVSRVPAGIPAMKAEDARKFLVSLKEKREQVSTRAEAQVEEEPADAGDDDDGNKEPDVELSKWIDQEELDATDKGIVSLAVKGKKLLNEHQTQLFSYGLRLSAQDAVDYLDEVLPEILPDDLKGLFRKIDSEVTFATEEEDPDEPEKEENNSSEEQGS